MKSKVFFTTLKAEKKEDNRIHKIKRIIEAAGLINVIKEKDLTAIKLHFGERGNDTFIAPWYFRPMVDAVKAKGGKPFLTDTNTLYLGSRKNSINHLQTAIEHGFGFEVTGAPLVIADGLTGQNYLEVEINKDRFQKVKIASDIYYADAMLVISHFKGHVMAGFGGAIKNLAMGCAPAAGKIEQHSARPVSDPEKCTGCGICTNTCPQDTIELVDGKSVIHPENCIGCGECMANCPSEAIELNWEAEIPPFVERLTEYAYGAWSTKKGKIGFLNFVVNVTPDCDCMSWSGEPIVRDIGILASTDPVAIDKACYDLVNKEHGLQNTALKNNYAPGEDKFKGIHENLMGERQFSHGQKIGLGSPDYELITIE